MIIVYRLFLFDTHQLAPASVTAVDNPSTSYDNLIVPVFGAMVVTVQ